MPASAPSASASVAPERAQPEPAPDSGDVPAEPVRQGGPSEDRFISPFEDELDVPTFLRRRGDDDDEDRETPAFLRRSAD